MTDYDPQVGRAMPADPDQSSAQSSADDEDLQVGLAGLAGMVSDAPAVEEVLAQVARFAMQAIPAAEGAGVTLLREPGQSATAAYGPPDVLSWAATDLVRQVDLIQYELLHEGPCIMCMQTLRPVVSGSLGSDPRWPQFGGRVARLGLHSALSLPLLVRGVVVGAINSYASQRDAFTEHAVRLGEQFAGPAAVAARNAQLLRSAFSRAEQLQVALTTRAVIDQAIGILRSRSGGSSEEAFDRLRQISQTDHVKLAVVAQHIVEEAVRRAHARHTAG